MYDCINLQTEEQLNILMLHNIYKYTLKLFIYLLCIYSGQLSTI